MKNPYADKDGGPKPGMSLEWDEWIQQANEIRRAALSPEARAEEDQRRAEIKARMQAESDFR